MLCDMSSDEQLASSSTSSLIPVINIKTVDEAFERMFGYAWGTVFGTTTITAANLPQELIDIFGSKQKVARIVHLPSTTIRYGSTNTDGSLSSPTSNSTTVVIDAAKLLTKRIDSSATTSSNSKRKSNWILSSNDEFKKSYQRRRVEENDDVVVSQVTTTSNIDTTDVSSSTAAVAGSKNTTAITTSTNSTGNTNSSTTNLDSVLQQLAGPKKLNTVEKTNEDWESFKGTDKALQDELERTAQSKDAYLVKQDFLQRVDQRRFEIEKTERDYERARRAAATSSSSSKK
jgi:Bucentaur or craniofacial development